MIVEGNNIIKKYKRKIVLNNVSFAIDPGEVYGILGKNGAGKSTLIKMILGLVFPNSGQMNVFGKKAWTGNKRIGYISENINLYPHLNAYEHIKISAMMSNVKINKTEIISLLHKVGLSTSGNKVTKDFSLGMKRRLQLVLAIMIEDVDFLILDEPTNGLDVNGMIWFKNMIKEFQDSNKTILMATHSIKEMEELITKYIIIDQGEIIKKGNWDKKNNKVIGAKIDLLPTSIEKCINLFKTEDIEVISHHYNTLTIKSNLTYRKLLNLLSNHEIFPDHLEMLYKSLEKVFIESTEGKEVS